MHRRPLSPLVLTVAVYAVLTIPTWGRPQPTRVSSAILEPATGMEFVLLPAGEFLMGSPEDVIGREPQEVLHRVRITQPFHMSRTEVTQAQWVKVMGTNPSHFPECANCPVENVSWFGVQEFIARLNDKTEKSFRLPTEAEWEYACRAGATSPFHTGENLTTDQANYDGRYPYPGQARGVYRERTTEVASFEPNSWGLYDMHGNVWEWCGDWHCSYPEGGEVDDPLGDCDSQLRVIRGGSWYFNADSARCALRYTHRPQDVGPSLGFRLVRETSSE